MNHTCICQPTKLDVHETLNGKLGVLLLHENNEGNNYKSKSETSFYSLYVKIIRRIWKNIEMCPKNFYN